ncbi:stage II sporulation protein M [Paenibacillus marinisediminis]
MLSFKSFLRTCGEIKWYIVVSALLLIGGYFIGNTSESLQQFLTEQLKGIEQLAAQASNSDNQELSFFITIFYRNLMVAVFMMFAGVVFALFPIVTLVLNGMILGFLIKMVTASGADLSTVVVRGLLPHGVLEMTAVVIAAAYGLRYGVLAIQRMSPQYRSRPDSISLQMWAKKTGAGAVWIAVMLLVAAIIESTITLWLVTNTAV